MGVLQCGQDSGLDARRPSARDPAFLRAGLQVLAQDGDLDTARTLVDKGLSTEDLTLRYAALGAAAASGHKDVGTYLLTLDDKRLRNIERQGFFNALSRTA